MGDVEDPEELLSVTSPCAECLVASSDLVRFMGFVTQLAINLDEVGGRETLEDDSATIGLHNHSRMISEVMLARAVDNFQTYLSALLGLIFVWRPETLKSERTIAVSEVLAFESRDELVEALAERRVESLAYQGMRNLNAHMAKRLGFPLFVKEDTLERAVRLVAARNAVVHNRGLANRQYLSDTGGSSGGLGEFIWIGDVYMHIDFLEDAALEIDGRARAKFDLPTVEIRRVGSDLPEGWFFS